MIAACVKWVPLRPEVDPLHGQVDSDPQVEGFSDSDLAAVEVALRLAEPTPSEVVVVCVGGAAADGALRDLLAAGASRAVRIEPAGDHVTTAPTSAEVARVIASAWLSAEGPTPEVVVCGDASADRGSGSVPAFLAHELGAAQALGLVAVDRAEDGSLRVVRRLDGGRREVVRVTAPAVISVEGSVARLRRASLAATLATRDAEVEVRRVHVADPGDEPRTRPWRPRPRALPAPSGERALDRIVALTGALAERTPPRTLVLDPPEAAAAIVAQLREWGYLDGGEPAEP